MSTNPFTLEAFADWIKEHRDPDTRYEYRDSSVCACAQYARHLGVERWMQSTNMLAGGFWSQANEIAGAGSPHFGALHSRLRYAIAREKINA